MKMVSEVHQRQTLKGKDLGSVAELVWLHWR